MNQIMAEVMRRAQERYNQNSLMGKINKMELLRKFYSSMRTDVLKLEVRDYGLHVPDISIRAGLKVEYGEMNGQIVKYKLSGFTPEAFNLFLLQHIDKKGNVCLYFNEEANNVFAFNIDNNEKEDNEKYTDKLKETQCILQACLDNYGIEPIILASGRGYHTWVRINENINNNCLCDFMAYIWAKTRLLQERMGMGRKFDISLYPARNSTESNSLRIFGSEHIKNKIFSYVIHPSKGILDEAESWRYFEHYMKNKTLAKEPFMAAYEKIKKLGEETA